MDNEEENNITQFDESGDRIIKIRELTEEEKLYMQRARERHRNNLTKQQSNFKGSSFISKPEKIIFKDFTIGKTHEINLTLTNVSNAFCSFNIVPFNERIRNFFEVDYIRQGRISPGLSCNLKIRFTPLVNQDIQDYFHILAETGPISYPLICTSKKTVVTCLNTNVDFGKVVFGEKGRASIRLVNSGSLPSDFVFKGPDGSDILKSSSPLEQLQYLNFDKSGHINGQSELVIPLQVSPTKVSKESLVLQIHFANFKHSLPIVINITWDCIQVPVFIEQQLYDLQLCLTGHVYRRKLIFHNRSQNPMKINIVQSPQTKRHFQFNPTLGFIQGSSTMQVWVKIILDKEFETYLAEYKTTNQQQTYLIPFKLVGAQQLVPVTFQIKLRITPSKLIIRPMNLEFGNIWEGSSSKVELIFQNTSQLCQELMLYPIPKNIRVEDGETTIKILPLGTYKTSLIYDSEKLVGTKSKFEEGAIPIKIITGNLQTQDVRLTYSAQVARAQLTIDKNKIQFPAIPIQEKADTYFQLRNQTSKSFNYEVFLPPFQISGLKMIPPVGILEASSSTQISLQYLSAIRKLTVHTFRKKQESQQPKLKELPPVQPPKKQSKKQGKDAKKETKLTKQQQEQLEAEQKLRQEQQRERAEKEKLALEQLEKNFDNVAQLRKYGGELVEFEDGQHYKWVVPVYFRQKNSNQTSKVTYLEISTTSVQKKLFLDTQLLDFGEVAVGTRETRPLRLTNNDDQSQIYKDQLPTFSGFSLLNSLRVLDKGSSLNYLVEFQPNEQLQFQQRLTLRTDHQVVSCLLRGKGVRPEVKLQPENGILSMGNILLGEFSQKTFKIRNVTNFQLKFRLQTRAEGIQNVGAVKAITCIPGEGFIPANKDIEIKVKFKPECISQQFYQLVSIVVPEQKAERSIYIFGSCYNRQAFVTQQKIPKLFTPDELPKRVEYLFDALNTPEDIRVYGPNNNKIIIQFLRASGPDVVEEAYKRKYVVGSCKLIDPKAEKPTNFEIIMPKDDKFICDNIKGTVPPGGETVITFTYKPLSEDPIIANVELLKGIGQWKDVKGELKLSGGFLKTGAQDLCSLQLIFRAYVNQL